MARLDGVSKELYEGEIKDAKRIYKGNPQYPWPTGPNRTLQFQLVNTRIVDRKVASGHKVVYINRGVFRG